ncbi:MAG TPA: hypothetical protein VGY31_14355 [Terriglobia bacterium]|nr:hypothetical protein [Terriglobia bacterium]
MAASKNVTIHGYVIDSSCALTKNLKKPVSPECAVACAKAGSPLVIITGNGTIYWPISDATPAQGQNARLMTFAGKRVTVSGNVYEKGGSEAIVIKTIQLARNDKEDLK